MEGESRKLVEVLRFALLPFDYEKQPTMSPQGSREHMQQLMSAGLPFDDPKDQQRTREIREMEIDPKDQQRTREIPEMEIDPKEQQRTREIPEMEIDPKKQQRTRAIHEMKMAVSFEKQMGELPLFQREVVLVVIRFAKNTQRFSDAISRLEEHIIRLETQDLPKDMANKKLDILEGGGDVQVVDMDRGKSAMEEEQLPSIDSRLTRLETEREAMVASDTKKELERESGKLMEQHQQSEVLSCGPAVQVHDAKQMQSKLRWHLETLETVVQNPERIEAYLGTILDMQSDLMIAEHFLMQQGHIAPSQSYPVKRTRKSKKRQQKSHPSSAPVSCGSDKGKGGGHATTHPESMDDISESLSLLGEQVKMEGEPFSSRDQPVTMIQDSELKSGPTVEDPFLTLLDMPFASADDDDDNKEDIINRGKSAEQIANEEEMACEEKKFALYRSCWEDLWEPTYGYFKDKTAVSPMHFTHSTPGCRLDSAACFGTTLQIFSIKLVEIKGGIKWPLFVYGLVAARDDVDHNRNHLFYCSRTESQKLDQDDPFLRLIGPSRAILFTDHVKFEVQLRLKGATASQDRALISAFCDYTDGHYPGVSTTSFENCFCTTELCLEPIEQTVQATIVSVRVKNGPWPFEYGGEVACYAPSYNTAPSSMNVVLLSSRGRPMPKGLDGYLHLSRNVVSVDLKGSLTFFVHAYSHSGEITAQDQVCFTANKCNITQQSCFFHDPEVEVEITVAWSTLVSDKRRIASQGWMF